MDLSTFPEVARGASQGGGTNNNNYNPVNHHNHIHNNTDSSNESIVPPPPSAAASAAVYYQQQQQLENIMYNNSTSIPLLPGGPGHLNPAFLPQGASMPLLYNHNKSMDSAAAGYLHQQNNMNDYGSQLHETTYGRGLPPSQFNLRFNNNNNNNGINNNNYPPLFKPSAGFASLYHNNNNQQGPQSQSVGGLKNSAHHSQYLYMQQQQQQHYSQQQLQLQQQQLLQQQPGMTPTLNQLLQAPSLSTTTTTTTKQPNNRESDRGTILPPSFQPNAHLFAQQSLVLKIPESGGPSPLQFPYDSAPTTNKIPGNFTVNENSFSYPGVGMKVPPTMPPPHMFNQPTKHRHAFPYNNIRQNLFPDSPASSLFTNNISSMPNHTPNSPLPSTGFVLQQQQQQDKVFHRHQNQTLASGSGGVETTLRHHYQGSLMGDQTGSNFINSSLTSSSSTATTGQQTLQQHHSHLYENVVNSSPTYPTAPNSSNRQYNAFPLLPTSRDLQNARLPHPQFVKSAATTPPLPPSSFNSFQSSKASPSSSDHHHHPYQQHQKEEEEGGVPSIIPMIDISNTTTEVEITCLINNDSEASQDPNLPSSALGGVGRKGRYIKRDGTLSKYPKKKKKTDAEEGGTPINPPTPMVMDQATYRNIDESIDCILARHNCNTHKSQLENDCAPSDMIIHERASSLVETTMITSPSGLPPVSITTVHLNSDNSIIINNNTTNNLISESADIQTYNNKSSLTTTKPHESGDSPRINSNESSLLNQPESLLIYQNVDHPTITTSNSLSIDSIPLNFSSEDNIPPISHDSISHKDNENFLKSEISTVADSDQSNILTGVTTPSGGYSHQIFSSIPNAITTPTTYLPEDQTTTSSNLSFFKEETTNMSGGGGSSLNFPAVLYPPTSSSSTAVHPSSHNNTISCQGGSEQDIIVAISPYSNSSNQYKFHPGPPAANLGSSSSTSNGVKLTPPHHASPFAANTTHNLNAISHNSPHLLSPGAGSIQSFSTTTDDNRGSIGNLVSGGSQITARKNEPISKLYEFGNEPDRRLFLDHLLKFNDQNANHLPFVPTVSKAYVDLYKLYHMVKERGGVVLVNQRKLWKEIAVYVLEGQSNPVSASYNLRKQYVKCLLDYECKYDLNGADPAPIIAQLEASTKKKKKKLPDPNLSSDKDNYNNNNLESHQNISSTNSQQQGISSKPPPQLPTSNFPKNPEIRHHQTPQDLIYPLNHHPHHHHPNTALLYHPSPYHPLASSSLSISLNSNSNTASAAGAQSSPAFMNVPPSPRVLPISSSSAVASYQQQQQQTQLLPPQPYPPSQHSFNSSYHQPPPPPYFNAPKDMMMAARSISPYHQPLAPPPLNYAPPQQQPLNVVPRYSSSMVARPLYQPFMYEDPQQRNYVRNPFSDNDPKLNNLLPKYPPPPNTRMLQQQHSHPFVQQPPPLSPYPQQHQQQNSSYQQQHFVPPLQINPLLHNQDINSNVGGTTSFPQSSSLLLHHKSFINNNETRLPTAACSMPRSHPIRFNHHLDSQSLFSSSTQNTSSYPGIPPTTVVMLPPHYPLTTNALGGAEIDYPLTPRVKSEYDLTSYSTTPTNGMTEPHLTNDVNHPNYGNNKFHVNSMGAYPGGNQQHLSSVFTSDYRDSPNLNPNNNFLHKIIPQSPFRNSINTTSVTTLSTQLNNLSSPFFSGDPSLHPHPSLHSHNLSAIDHYSSSPFNHNNRGTATRLGGFQDILPPPNIAITENSIDPKSLKYPPTNNVNLMRTPMIPHGHYQQQQLVSERTPFSLPGFKGGDLNAHQFVEGTVVKSVKFRKNVIAVANKDQNGAVAFDIIRKLIMVLKSGIFHLYTAALDTLNVLLSDDTKNTQFQLTNLPPDFLDLILQYCEICFATTLFCIKKTPTISNGGIISFEFDRHRNMILEPKLTEEIIEAGLGRVKAAYEEAEQEAEEEKLRAGKRETRTSTKRAHASSGGGNLVNSKKVKNYAWITRRKKQRVKVISDTTTKKSSFFPSPFHALIYEDKEEAEYIDDDNGLNQLVRLNIMRLDVDLARFRQEDRFNSTRRLEKYEECGDNLPDKAAVGLDISRSLGGYNSDNTLVPLDERVETNLFPFITQRSYDNVLLGNKMCLGVCNILRNLSFIPTNDTYLAKNERLLNLVADVLLLKHTHSKRDCGIGTETSAPNSLIFGNCSSADPAAPPAEAATALEREVWLAISRDSLVILSNLSSKLDLSVLPDLLISRLLVSLLHTLVCNDHVKLPIAQNIAQSLGSTISSSNQHLPPLHQPPRRYMVLEILSKLTVSETNSDYLVALSDLATLESLIGLLVELLMLNTVGHPEIMVLKELSLILLTNLGGGGGGTDSFEITTLPAHLFAPSAVPINSTPATLGGCTSEGSGRLILDLVSHHARSVPALLQFMEEIEANASRIIHNQGFPALRDNPELMGTSLAMLRRCANLLLSITTKTSNLKLLEKYQGRLLNLVMSQILDQNVANILAQVLYISSVVIPRCCPS